MAEDSGGSSSFEDASCFGTSIESCCEHTQDGHFFSEVFSATKEFK